MRHRQRISDRSAFKQFQKGSYLSGRGYMLPFARVETRAAFAAMNIAACAGVKRYAPRNAVNMVL